MERGGLLQGAILAAQLRAIQSARDAESEADLYGMGYMKKAGYDPRAAIPLHETFVRLSQGHKTAVLEGMFASHPPSEARVAQNRKTAVRLGEGGFLGEKFYPQKSAHLRQTQAAFEAHAEALKALAKGDRATASSKTAEAMFIEPRERISTNCGATST